MHGYDRLYSVTAILLDLQHPSFDTLMYNSKFSFSMQFRASGTAVVKYLVSIAGTGIRGGQHVLQVWRVSQQPLSKQPATVVPVDMPLLKQLVSGLLVLNLVESAPQTLVCAVIYASTKDRIDSTTTVHVFVDID